MRLPEDEMDDDPVAHGLVRGLIFAPNDKGLRQQIVSRGATAVRPLIRMLVDRAMWDETAPGEGLAPVTAAELLGELRAPEAVAPLVDALWDLDADDVLFSAVIRALCETGPAAMEPVLALLAAIDDNPTRAQAPWSAKGACHEILSCVGQGDERVFQLLCAAAIVDPQNAGYLATFGDPRALPLLESLAESYRLRSGKGFANHGWTELYAAIETLAGEVPEAVRAKDIAMRRSGGSTGQ